MKIFRFYGFENTYINSNILKIKQNYIVSFEVSDHYYVNDVDSVLSHRADKDNVEISVGIIEKIDDQSNSRVIKQDIYKLSEKELKISYVKENIEELSELEKLLDQCDLNVEKIS